MTDQELAEAMWEKSREFDREADKARNAGKTALRGWLTTASAQMREARRMLIASRELLKPQPPTYRSSTEDFCAYVNTRARERKEQERARQGAKPPNRVTTARSGPKGRFWEPWEGGTK